MKTANTLFDFSLCIVSGLPARDIATSPGLHLRALAGVAGSLMIKNKSQTCQEFLLHSSIYSEFNFMYR